MQIIRTPFEPSAPPPFGAAWLRLAFRPFYLGAATAAVVLMALWLPVYEGTLTPRSGLAPSIWHAHEMLFGFAAAVVVGFLLTAGKTWTGLPTPRGPALAALFVLWAVARLACVFGPHSLFFVLDVAFLPTVAALFLRLLVRAKNWRNLGVAGVLAALGAVNLAFHLSVLDVLPWPARSPLLGGLALLIVLETVIGGRVIPAFTASVTPGLRLPPTPWLNATVIVTTVLGFVSWLWVDMPALAATMLAAASLAQAARAMTWAPWKAVRRPILLVLHAAFAWIPVGLALLAASQWQLVPESAGVHALAVGATGGLIMAMITRTARGHTGRPIVASKLEITSYVAIALAAIARVIAAMSDDALRTGALLTSGALWITAFVLYLTVFTPWLMQTRADGRDG